MNRLLLVVSFLIVAAFDVQASEVESASISKVNSLIIEIQKGFAPDKRTERFHVFTAQYGQAFRRPSKKAARVSDLVAGKVSDFQEVTRINNLPYYSAKGEVK